MRPLILASTSRYRRSLLERIAPPFEAQSPEVSEAHLGGESPRERAMRLSLAKARAVAEKHPNAVVIGSDQVCASGQVLPAGAVHGPWPLRLVSTTKWLSLCGETLPTLASYQASLSGQVLKSPGLAG